MWQSDGLKPSAAVTRATKAYRSEMDLVQQWLDERIVADLQASIPRSEAYSDYRFWSEQEHIPALGKRRFIEELHARGLRAEKSNGVWLFKGVRLQPMGPRHFAGGPALHVVGGTAAKP
jgi:putative DNA primase/helicase